MIPASSSPKEPLTVCYILSYRFPRYVRAKTLTEALKGIDDPVLFEAVNTMTGPLRYLQTLARLWAVRIRRDPDCYILGFRGHELFWPVRLLTRGKPLIVDHMMSPWDSLVNEKRRFRKGGMVERFLYRYERLLLHAADGILTDTDLHADFLADSFGLRRGAIRAVPVGADEDLFAPPPPGAAAQEDDLFHVFFYGTFLPLHGVPVILEAAAMLRDRPVRFTLVGGKGTDLADFHAMRTALGLERVTHREWVPYERLPGMIAEADLCLGGPFGDTGQSNRVVTGKTFQFLAMGKPTVVGRIDGDFGFEDRKNCLLVSQGDGGELARSILWCLEHREELGGIGRRGRDLYRARFSTGPIGDILREFLATCAPQRGRG